MSPTFAMQLHKYHALGNDYLVLTEDESPTPPEPELIKSLCHRHFGIGADGLLYGQANNHLRIYNSDGSEAEISGNGLRIYAQFLYDQKRAPIQEDFTIRTPFEAITAHIKAPNCIQIQMGKFSFKSFNHPLQLKDRTITASSLTVGNPHCVVPLPEITEKLCRELGPHIEMHSFFPGKTNVQLLKVLDTNNIQIEIWERGSGYTLASGSSACAAAATAYKMNLTSPTVQVHSPGGTLQVDIHPDDTVTLTGPVTYICEASVNIEALTLNSALPKDFVLNLTSSKRSIKNAWRNWLSKAERFLSNSSLAKTSNSDPN